MRHSPHSGSDIFKVCVLDGPHVVFPRKCKEYRAASARSLTEITFFVAHSERMQRQLKMRAGPGRDHVSFRCATSSNVMRVIGGTLKVQNDVEATCQMLVTKSRFLSGFRVSLFAPVLAPLSSESSSLIKKNINVTPNLPKRFRVADHSVHFIII